MNVWKYYRNLPKSKKIQFTAASAVTAVLIVSLPVSAWFAYQRGIVKLQKIQSPNALVLSAAHREDSVNFEINGINAEENVVDGENNPITVNGETPKITHKDYVFTVTGSAVDHFTIQLAYTTNNPFTYEVYAANELTAPPTAVAGVEKNYVSYVVKDDPASGIPTLTGNQYHLDVAKNTILYYTIDSGCSGTTQGQYIGTYLNMKTENGSLVKTDAYHHDTYEQATEYTNVHADAEPVYWQATGVSAFPGEVNANKEPFSRSFILRVKWSKGALVNTTKETDIVYITVKATG